MSETEFSGNGKTIEEAFNAAASAAIKSFQPHGFDELVRVELVSIGAIYGGFIGYVGEREVVVRLGASPPKPQP
jgi:hypothetical protein